MRGFLAFACLSAVLACSQANAAQVRFVGGFVFLSATGACADWNPTGDRGIARFRPQVAGSDNGNGSRIGLFFHDGALGWRLDNGLFTSAFKATQFGNVFDGPGHQGPTDIPIPRVRFLSQTPASITATTQTVTIVAEAQNFDWQAGCTPRFRMVLQRRPD